MRLRCQEKISGLFSLWTVENGFLKMFSNTQDGQSQVPQDVALTFNGRISLEGHSAHLASEFLVYHKV